MDAGQGSYWDEGGNSPHSPTTGRGAARPSVAHRPWESGRADAGSAALRVAGVLRSWETALSSRQKAPSPVKDEGRRSWFHLGSRGAPGRDQTIRARPDTPPPQNAR